MNDEERLKTVREILGLVSNITLSESKVVAYWGFDTEMDAESVEKPALEALKKFEAKVREEEDLSIQDPVLFPYES